MRKFLPHTIACLAAATLTLSVAPTLAAGPAGKEVVAPKKPIEDWCNRVTLVIPQIKRRPCVAAGLKAAPVQSVNGEAIMLRDFVALPGQTAVQASAQSSAQPHAQNPAPRVLVIGGIHGDELTATSIVFRWMERLAVDGSPARRYTWRVVPVLNPDGLLAKPPTRTNANKVDLNRNFPTLNWLKEAPRYWEGKTRRDPRRFPGNAPLSEPESRWLHDEVVRFAPDVIVSVHAPYGVLDFDGPPKGVAAPTRFGRLHLNRVGIYPGSLGNFGGYEQGIPVVTLELPHALNMPSEAELNHVWEDMQDWLQKNLIDRKMAAAKPASDTVKAETKQAEMRPADAAKAAAPKRDALRADAPKADATKATAAAYVHPAPAPAKPAPQAARRTVEAESVSVPSDGKNEERSAEPAVAAQPPAANEAEKPPAGSAPAAQ
jgi:murein peptide amidase A